MRSKHGGSTKLSLSTDNCAASFDLDIRAHTHQFLSVHEAILEDVLGHNRRTLGLRRESHVLRLHVGWESGMLLSHYVSATQFAIGLHANGILAGSDLHSTLLKFCQQRAH